MRRLVLVFIFGVLMTSVSCAVDQSPDKNENPADKWTEAQKLSYIFGLQMGQLSKDGEFTIDLETFSKGLDDIIKGSGPAMNQQQSQEIMAKFQQEMQERQMAALNAAADDNLKTGKTFLEENRRRNGVKETASGLQYKVIQSGDGPKPKSSDRVKVHYSGKLINGREFDSSYKRNQPAEFGLSQIIQGWTEGLQLMNVGSKYELYIPADLAYGNNAPPAIGPNQTLIFEVELLEIL